MTTPAEDEDDEDESEPSVVTLVGGLVGDNFVTGQERKGKPVNISLKKPFSTP